jgi:hypothetical protein
MTKYGLDVLPDTWKTPNVQVQNDSDSSDLSMSLIDYA